MWPKGGGVLCFRRPYPFFGFVSFEIAPLFRSLVYLAPEALVYRKPVQSGD